MKTICYYMINKLNRIALKGTIVKSRWKHFFFFEGNDSLEGQNGIYCSYICMYVDPM